MTLQEKKLYHQIHPLQILTDLISAFLAVYLLWEGYLVIAVVVGFVPSTAVSMWIIAKVDLEKYKASAFGSYLHRHMASKAIDWLRFAGFVVMLIGGWNHWLWCVAAGFLVVLLCWFKGLIAGAFEKKR